MNLHDALPGLDRSHLALVLAAVSHAGGSHEQAAGPIFGPGGAIVGFDQERLGPLVAWPDSPGPVRRRLRVADPITDPRRPD